MPGRRNSSLKDPELYEELREDGASKEKAARISNAAARDGRSAVGRRGGEHGGIRGNAVRIGANEHRASAGNRVAAAENERASGRAAFAELRSRDRQLSVFFREDVRRVDVAELDFVGGGLAVATDERDHGSESQEDRFHRAGDEARAAPCARACGPATC